MARDAKNTPDKNAIDNFYRSINQLTVFQIEMTSLFINICAYLTRWTPSKTIHLICFLS
jgi:hypothetical protein